ncbi:M43 family zinc metalloprotease [Flavobacterium rivuli]|uniref:M43 family zinc metalloprotease n=1 Tax=Flavobacterium rivuli TaxID=498301 RepID=UPI000361C3E6|nr:M43 family zinc metalloprotease [Flavobacterium rivuli]
MKNNTLCKTFLFAMLFSATCFTSNAQELPKVFGRTVKSVNPENGQIRCASAEYEEYQQEHNSKKDTRAQFENWLAKKIQERKAQRSTANVAEVITIPVVVHVIHNGDALGVNENIPDGQVQSQIEVLNQDYRRMAGTNGYNSLAVGADVEIEFCLAQTDPDGNLTNGIDRIRRTSATYNSIEIFDSSVKPATSWDPEQYMNIWTCSFGGSSSGLLGYAQFPDSSGLGGLDEIGGNEGTDGVVIGYQYFGSEDIFPEGNYGSDSNQNRYGRTATHEVGHFLGLRHIWGDNDDCRVNTTDSFKDYCPDTPAASEEHYNCQTYNSCPTAPGNDMKENYMDYTNDLCLNIFTQNQKTRIRTVMENSPRRASLVTSTACQAPTGGVNKYKLQGLKVFPNPAQGELTIDIPNGDLPDSYTIYNSVGQTVSTAKINSNANLTINTGNYSNGVYFIKVNKGSESKTLKFIKN